MLESIRGFIDELIIYDYILFGSILLVFVIFIILSIVFRRSTIVSTLLLLVGFGVLFGGSFVGYKELHSYLFKHTLTINESKKLTYTKAIVLKATLKNESKRVFNECKISASVYRKKEYKLVEEILKLKPIAKMSIVESNIDIDSTRDIKMLIEPFDHDGDFGVTLSAKCR
ncbi:MAG: DUF2393 family protein [Sulfurimonas sp.]|jgi:hypothetical protein|nr:DUF2393 family protein [Sulfurimonadaceae bacterium]